MTEETGSTPQSLSETTSRSTPEPVNERNGGWAFAGNLGKKADKIQSNYGKKLHAYWLKEQHPGEEADRARRGPTDEPPFAVVGMGRCGCHVTTALAQMIAVASGRKKPSGEGEGSWNLIARLFRSDALSGVLHVEPIMLVGDIDETTYDDIEGLLTERGEDAKMTDRILKFNYKPLAVGGAGHVPLFAEFLTQGLLLLPPINESGKAKETQWESARSYLIDSYTRGNTQARLVFYVFSTGGGTGCGSAAELMRAQRYAISQSRGPEPQIYFTGFGVLPADVRTSKRRQINSGRMLTQYLADLNIKLDHENDYGGAPTFLGSRFTESDDGPKILLPWDGLALVSNDVMFVEDMPDSTREEAETKANQYMAQQMFNLAASQFQTEEYERDNAMPPSQLNYQSIRLDPQDLRNGLNGPYAIAFAAAGIEEVDTPSWLENLFVRAIALPRYHEKRANELVEGISVAPEAKDKYGEKIDRILSQINIKEDSQPKDVRITKEMLSDLANIRMFNSCPRAIFVLTAPQTGFIPADTEERLTEYLGYILPNVDTVRSAIVRGTTKYFTLSLYLESSVILCPDVLLPIMNYIKLCWPKLRNTPAAEYMEQFNAIISQEPPIDDGDIREWIGENEMYGANVANFSNLANSHDRNWKKFVENSDMKDKNRQDELMAFGLSEVFMTPAEVASALRFINYVYHCKPPETVSIDDYFS